MMRAIQFQRERNGVLVRWSTRGPSATFIPDDEWDAIYAFTSRGSSARGDTISPTRTTPNRDPLDAIAKHAETGCAACAESAFIRAASESAGNLLGRDAIPLPSGDTETRGSEIRADGECCTSDPSTHHNCCADCCCSPETYSGVVSADLSSHSPRHQSTVRGKIGEGDEGPEPSDSDIRRLVRALSVQESEDDERADSDAERHSRLMEGQAQSRLQGTSVPVAPADEESGERDERSVPLDWTHSG